MAKEEHAHLLDALAAIDPATLDYQGWVECGMALHESGFDWRDWDEWSARDHARYHEGECELRWQTFGNHPDRVSSGSIIKLAEARGWRQPTSGMGDALDWGDMGTVQAGPDVTSAETMPLMDADVGDWDPCRMLYDYIDALFEDSEHVGYVTESFERDGRKLPTKGCWDRTAGQLKEELAKYGDMGAVLGDWDETAGAWIRFNPLDGEGCGNTNVIDRRYALVESDVLDMDRQFPAIKELNLPCAAVVSSGGKSVHAIVRVDASSAEEYRKRVRWLYDYCDRHGFVTDKNNKNESRLSRMPGATRNGKRQLLLATNIGASSWDEWKKWAEESEDDLPDEIVGGVGEPVELNPILIGTSEDDGILRKYSKMMLVGDSKMGKSTTLIDLAQAICVGGEWLGMQCAEGKVYYINLELDMNDFRDRMNKVWSERPESADQEALGKVNKNFVHMPMKGRADLLWEIAQMIIRRILKYGPPKTFAAVIIDPIYKINGGDDNDARAVAKFTNTLDLITQACGCAVIYAHHHPKGATGNRRALDRMSGSGVYGRDADTVIDFSPLFVPDELWQRFDRKPLFRAEITCRGFGSRRPIDCAFNYPRFYRDVSGELAKCKVLGEDVAAERNENAAKKREEQAEEMRDQAIELMREAMTECVSDGIEHNPTSQEIFDHMPEAIRDGTEKLGGKKVTLNRVKGWSKKSSNGFLGPFHNVCENGLWGVVDDKSS